MTQRQVEQLCEFAELLIKWNKHFNLVSRRDIQRIGPRHLLDSLAGAGLLRGTRVLDLGSGAGLPGIPLAIAQPDLSFTLLDRNARRCRFLRQVLRALGLARVQVIEAELATLLESADKFDTVVARGVATAREVWAKVHTHVAEQGRVLVYASTQAGSEAGHKPEFAQQDEIRISQHTYQIPGLEQTHIIDCVERASSAAG